MSSVGSSNFVGLNNPDKIRMVFSRSGIRGYLRYEVFIRRPTVYSGTFFRTSGVVVGDVTVVKFIERGRGSFRF